MRILLQRMHADARVAARLYSSIIRMLHVMNSRAEFGVGGSITAVRTGVPENESICACHIFIRILQYNTSTNGRY